MLHDKEPNEHFICVLCQTMIKSARRMVKHILSHGVDNANVLEHISVGDGADLVQVHDLF